MLKTWFVFLSCVFLFVGNSFAAQLDAGSIINNLPRAYTGSYQWENSDDLLDVSISFSEVKKRTNGDVEITGKENFINQNDKNKTYESNIRAVIDPQTLTFEMEEISEKKEDFTPMVYKGTISSDLITINAYWISPKGRKVSMALKKK
jgi:hypothetical protein